MPLLRAKVNSAGTYSYIRLPQRFKGREVLILMEEDEKLFSQVIRDAYLLSSSLDYERRKIKEELNALWKRYQDIINTPDSSWEKLNEARAILYLTGQIYCEEIAVEAIERRLHLLKEKLTLLEFFDIIDKKSEKLKDLRKEGLFKRLEEFYIIVKQYKNKYVGGKYYLDEEKFIQEYNKKNPNNSLKIGYKGSF